MSDKDGKIDYGMFIMPFHDPEKPLVQCYDEDLELITIAEQLGYKEFWIGEHHTMKYENIVMPEIFIARALGETSTIRLGPAPICVNQHHPAHVASRLAFLDHLSKGRLNLCLGPGSVSADMELYGAHPKDASKMTIEAIDAIVKLWTTDPPYEHNGEFWQFKLEKNVSPEAQLGYIHKPLQQPHPPISMPGSSMNSSTMKQCGARGYQPFCHCIIPGNVVANTWQTYEQAALEAGHKPKRSDWRVARSILVCDTTKEAVDRARTNSMGRKYEYIGMLMDQGIGHRNILKRDKNMSDSDCNLDYFMSEQMIVGDVDEVVRRLLALVEEGGTFGTLAVMGYDWDDRESWVHSMELFANEVMPALNNAVGCVT